MYVVLRQTEWWSVLGDADTIHTRAGNRIKYWYPKYLLLYIYVAIVVLWKWDMIYFKIKD